MVTRGARLWDLYGNMFSLVLVGIRGLEGCGWSTLVDGQELADLRHGFYESLEWVLLLSQNCDLLDCCTTDGKALDFRLGVPKWAHGVLQVVVLVGSEWLVNSISVSSGKSGPKLWLIHLMPRLEGLWLGQAKVLFFNHLIVKYGRVLFCRILFCVWFYHLQYLVLIKSTRVIVSELRWSVEVTRRTRRGFAPKAMWTMLWMNRLLVLVLIDNRELSLAPGPTGLLLH